MKQRLSLQQKLLQKLSPQQIQVIKLLEIPTLQLEQRIKKEIEENPVLELENEDNYGEEEQEPRELRSDEDKDDEEFSVEDYMPDDEIPGYKLSVNNYSPDDKHVEIPFSVGDTFHEFLQEQVDMAYLEQQQKMLAEYIIGNIDEDGYLRRDLSAISDDLAFNQSIDIPESLLLDVLKVIQSMGPPGVGARNLQECLLLQLERKNGEQVPAAIAIVRDSFEEFTRKHYDKIARRLGIDDNGLKSAIDLILKLNPKPGSSYSNPHNKSNQHIVPDFILENVDGELQLSLNQKNMPELRINDSYREMLKTLANSKDGQNKKSREAIIFVKQKIDSAKWFIDAIRQRQLTLLTTMSAIIDLQKAYFVDGDETKLKPMILKDISERTSLDISTISRVSNSKYIQTHFGVFPLKYFFSEAMQKDTGEEVSTREIKKILQECIDSEDKRHPLTDEKLTEILKEKSYNIARRTVAKYREQLEIPVARLRKEL
ncbi:MAG: RNA polymerase factor sigma-54 [Prolixibacteraceae bacterium]|nr:RNA polymerase factor sigma-54 [Prolixibacteraceae bacterium]